MTRAAIVSLVLTTLAVVSGCQRQPTTVPEAPAEKADFAPPEEYELTSAPVAPGASAVEEEKAPGLSRS